LSSFDASEASAAPREDPHAAIAGLVSAAEVDRALGTEESKLSAAQADAEAGFKLPRFIEDIVSKFRIEESASSVPVVSYSAKMTTSTSAEAPKENPETRAAEVDAASLLPVLPAGDERQCSAMLDSVTSCCSVAHRRCPRRMCRNCCLAAQRLESY